MDIHFCDRCRESIPDADLVSGRAVRLRGGTYHVGCALDRAMTGGGRVGVYVVAALALGLAGFAVARGFFPGSPDATAPGEPPVTVAEHREAVAGLRRQTESLLAESARTLEQQVGTAVGGAEQRITSQIRADLGLLQGRVEGWQKAMESRLQTVEDWRIEVGQFLKELKELRARVDAPGVATVTPDPTATPTPSPTPTDPATPGVDPGDPQKPAGPSPEERRRIDAELAKWIGHLKDPVPSVAFTATYKLKELGDLRAVPALVETLKTHRDYWTRQGAASALGHLKSCDGVPALVDALDDRELVVFMSANDALERITSNHVAIPVDPTSKERKSAREQWTKFWRDNEAAVRRGLGQ